MKISPLQNNIYANKQSDNVSFKGLWGETTRVVDKDPVLGVKTDYETYYYYPYMDESSSDIQKVLEENTTAYFDKNASVGTYVVKECKECTTLPFKKVHFDNYSAADSSTRMTQNFKKVHFSVQDKYINNTGEQKSAINPEMSARLFTKA